MRASLILVRVLILNEDPAARGLCPGEAAAPAGAWLVDLYPVTSGIVPWRGCS